MNRFEFHVSMYQVITSYEEQFSIWPDKKELPKGWKAQGKTGSSEECLAYIKERWTEIRPILLRRKLEEMRHKVHTGNW